MTTRCLPALLLVAGLVGSLALTGCSSSDPEPTAPRHARYVAIGDSYSSGIGIAPETSRECGRSARNYPTLLAERHPGTELVDVTCAGARPLDLTQAQQVLNGSRPPQIDAVDTTTDLITYSLAANEDLSFGTVVYQCVPLRPQDPQGAPCTEALGTEVPTKLTAKVAERTVDALTLLRERAPEARLVVVGYPQVFSATSCPAMPLADGDTDLALRINRAWNDGLARGASLVGADFLAVDALSQGHDVCGADPWINPMAVAGDTTRHSDGAPAHPREALHRAEAEALDRLVGAELPTP